MNELRLFGAVLAGLVLGALFFGGLWWTVQRAMASAYAALWFLLSLVLRTAIVLAGFYLVCADDWRRWLAAALGFGAARLLITRITRPKIEHNEDQEGRHAA